MRSCWAFAFVLMLQIAAFSGAAAASSPSRKSAGCTIATSASRPDGTHLSSASASRAETPSVVSRKIL